MRDKERTAPTSKPPIRTRVSHALALIFAGVVAALILAEIALRTAGLGTECLYTYAPHRGWKLNPGAAQLQTDEGRALVRINREGFRGPDVPYHKRPHTLRIVVLGDSFTEAQQVPFSDTFSQVIQRRLAARCPLRTATGRIYKRVQVLDFGVDGYGTAQELMTWRRHAFRYQPDIVILALFAGNDIRNNSVVVEGDKCRPFYVYRRGRLVLGGPFENSFWFHTRCMMRFESRHSRLLNVLGDARSAIRRYFRCKEARWDDKPGKPAGVELGINDMIYVAPPNKVWRDAWRVTDAEVGMLNSDVRASGARLLVVTLTTGVQVNPNPKIRLRYTKYVGAINLFYPEEHFAELGERDGFPVLTLAQPMQAYADVHHVFLHGFANTKLGVGHWNLAGHHLAGFLIARKLEELLGVNNFILPANSVTRGPDTVAH